MKITLARSKIKLMRNQKGLASVVVVMVLTVVITLISLGFARLMDRSVSNSTNNQASQIATYGAQSAINDVVSYIKDHPATNSSSCSGEGSLIGSSSQPGPFYGDSNLSGDTERSTRYSCLLVNQTPKDLIYQQLPPNKSRVVKLTTSAGPGELDKIMLSWQPTNTQVIGYPPGGTSLLDISTWNDPTKNYLPLLRVTLYPVPVGGSIANLQATSKTIFLYPQSGSGPVPTQSYSAMRDGSPLPVVCSQTVSVGSFSGSADYTCNLIISGLAAALAPPEKVDYFYLRIMPIYNQADVRIQANDSGGQVLRILQAQAVIDATAQSGGVAKRLQARVDISGSGENIDPTSDSIPEYALRSAGAICKRLVGVSSPYAYTQLDGPLAICNGLGDPIITIPAPTLDFRINGVDSEFTDDYGQKGTAYIDSSAALAWTSTDAAGGCNASAAPRADWSGDKNLPPSTWSGSTNSGSQNISGITDKTAFSLSCSGPGSSGAPLVKTVTAWPPPTVTLSGPESVNAGDEFELRWTVKNSVKCTASGSWSGDDKRAADGTYSERLSTSPSDYSARTYNLVCKDPSNRESPVATYTLNINCPGSDKCGKLVPPYFDFDADDKSLSHNGSTTLRWNVEGKITWCWGKGGTWGSSGSPKNHLGGSESTGNLSGPKTYTYEMQCGNTSVTLPAKPVPITVAPPPPPPPPEIEEWKWNSGDSFTYKVRNASTCTVTPDGQSAIPITPTLNAASQVTTGHPDIGATLSCMNQGVGPVTKYASVPPQPVVVKISIATNFWEEVGYDFSFKTTVDPVQPNDCRDGLHRLVLCFDIDAYQGSDTVSNRSKIAYCDIYTGGIKIDTSINDRGSKHWSRQGKWRNYTIGWFDLPRYTQPGQNYNFEKDVSVTCITKPEYGSKTGSDSEPRVRWTTCADRGQEGIYYTDVAQNGCTNPPPPPPPGPPVGDVIVRITDNRCVSRNVMGRCNRTLVSYSASQTNGDIKSCNESWRANNGSGVGRIEAPEGTFTIGGVHPGGSITVSCTGANGWIGQGFATLFY